MKEMKGRYLVLDRNDMARFVFNNQTMSLPRRAPSIDEREYAN